jgi:hypothetical protein
MKHFIICYTKKDKDKLIKMGFSYRKEISREGKYVFFNDGTLNFSKELSKMDIMFSDMAYV